MTLINQNIAAALKTVDLLVITSYFSSKEWEMLRSILTECFGAELYFGAFFLLMFYFVVPCIC